MDKESKKIELEKLDISKPMTLRLFDALTGKETTSEWDSGSLEKFTAKIRNDLPIDGQYVHCVSYFKVHRCIRNYDLNEIHLYWAYILGYDPVEEFNRKR